MNESNFSKSYRVRKLIESDINQIYALAKNNILYYQYCPPMVSKESLRDDMTALPPNMTIKSKYYVGFFINKMLIAVMDLIDGYPESNVAFIGFFMTNTQFQNNGLGTTIITELTEYLQSLKYQAMRLAWAKGNPQAEHFWIKNGFMVIKETTSSAAQCVILAEKKL